MIPNKEYWMGRALTREQDAYLRGTLLNKRMFNEYQKAADKLKKSIQSFYGKYATEHGVTYEKAMRKLTAREAREWKATLGEYVADISAAADPKVKADLIAQLDALSANSQISRLEALLADAQAQMDVMYERCREELTSGFGEIYTESYYHKHYDIQSRVGWVSEVAKLTPSMIQDAVSYPWSGAMFSDRLWQNKNALVFNIREIITQSLIQGKNLPETSKALSNKMGQSYKVAERLVRTETSHLHNRADLFAYEAAGVTEYEYMATMDARTCEVCGALDGKYFPIKDATPGVNFPPMHPNDRCTTVEYDPDDAADWAASGEKMPESMTYEEWKDKQGIEEESDVESYGDVKAYTISGPNDGTYIAFVSSRCKYLGINQTLPMLSEYYLYTTEDGSLKIMDDTDSDAAVTEAMKAALENEEVKNLIEQVQNDYQNALDADASLRAYVESIQ